MLVTLIATVFSAQPLAAEIQHRSHDVVGALKRGCSVQRVNIAGGRAEHMPIVRCPAARAEVKDARQVSRGG